MQAVNLGRQLFSARYHLWFRLFKAFLFLGVLSIIIILSNVCDLSFMDLIVCCLAFVPTGWGLILVSIVEENLFFLDIYPRFLFD
jgi:callose synthase